VAAADIGVDRAVEADVGAVVTGDDGLGLERCQAVVEPGRRGVLLGPAVVEVLPLIVLEPAGPVGLSAAAANGADDGS